MLSILIPTYNIEKLIDQTLDSVLNQPCKDLEVLVIDDGSSDRTPEILKEYEKKDSRVRVIIQENMGTGKTRNRGIPMLRGEWVIFLDHDDLMKKNFYTEEFHGQLEQYRKEGVELIVPARAKCDEDGSNLRIEKVEKTGVFGTHDPMSWEIKHEFFSLIYSGDLLRDNIQRRDLTFAETWPDIESVFRHKAAYLAKKVLFTNDYYFSIKRTLGSSIIHTWDFRVVQLQRFKSYRRLESWHRKVDPKDKAAYLMAVSLTADIVIDYILRSIKKRIPLKQVREEMEQAGMRKYLRGHHRNIKPHQKILLRLFAMVINRG